MLWPLASPMPHRVMRNHEVALTSHAASAPAAAGHSTGRDEQASRRCHTRVAPNNKRPSRSLTVAIPDRSAAPELGPLACLCDLDPASVVIRDSRTLGSAQ